MAIGKLSHLLLLVLFLFAFSALSSHARSISVPSNLHLLEFFKIKLNQTARSCSYTVTIKTSCSSTSYTRDKISLAFGDAYGSEVYVPRLDDPKSRTFERCSTDTFQIRGPCMRKACYIYLYRRGSDGWKPESVKIYGPSRSTVTFFFNAFVPNGVWFGFDLCHQSFQF